MISWYLVTWIIFGLVGAVHFLTWIFSDRSLSWTFSIGAIVFGFAFYHLNLKNFFAFGFEAALFVLFSFLYVYERQFIYTKVTRRRG